MQPLEIEITASDKGLEQTLEHADTIMTAFVEKRRKDSKEFTELFKDMAGAGELKTALEELSIQADRMFSSESESVRGLRASVQETQVSMRYVSDMMNDLSNQFKSQTISEGEYVDSMARLDTLYKAMAKDLSEVQSELNKMLASEQMEEGSIESLRAKLSSLTVEYQKLSAAQREGTEGKELLESMKETSIALDEATQNMKNYGADAVNTYSRIDGVVSRLGASLPNLLRSPMQLASQLPSMVQALSKAQEEYEAMSESGKETEPVWKQLIGAALNWKSALVALVPIVIANREAIAEWLTVLATGKTRLQTVEGATREVEEAFANANAEVAAQIIQIRNLTDEWRNLDSETTKEEWIKKNQSAFENLGISINDTLTAERLFSNSANTNAMVEALKNRAKAAVAAKLAEDKLSEALLKEFQSRKRAQRGDDYLDWADAEEARSGGTRSAFAKWQDNLIAKVARVGSRSAMKNSERRDSESEILRKLGESYGEKADKFFESLGLTSNDRKEEVKAAARNYVQSFLTEAARAIRESDESNAETPQDALRIKYQNALKDIAEDYNKALSEAKNNEKEALKEAYNQRVEAATAAYTIASNKLAEKEAADAKKSIEEEQKRLDALRNQYSSFEQTIQSIHDKANADRDAMKDANGNYREGFGEANTQAVDDWEKAQIEATQRAYATKTDEYQNWLKGVSKMTVDEVKAELDTVKTALAATDESVDPKTLALLETKIKELEAKLGNFNDETKDTKTNWTEIAGVFRESGQAFEEIGDAIGGVTGEMVKGLGNIVSSAGQMAVAIAAVGDAADGAEKASAILAAVSAALKVVSLFASAQRDAAEANEAAANAARNYVAELDRIADAQARAQNQTVFGNNSLGMFITNLSIAEDAMKKLSQSLSAYDEEQDKLNKTWVTVDRRTWWNRTTGLGRGTETVTFDQFKDATGMLDGEALKAWYKENSDAMDEMDKRIVQNLIDDWQRWKDAVDGAAQYLGEVFGNLASDISDAMVDSFLKTGDAVASVDDAVSGYAKTLAKSLIQSKLINQYFNEGLKDQLSQLVAQGDVAGAISVLKTTADEAMRNEGEWVNQLLSGIGDAFGGWDMEEAASSAAKGIAQASQDSVDEPNGRATAIQTHTFTINENVKTLAANSGQIVGALNLIVAHTSNLDAMRDYLDKIERHTDDMVVKGVTML